MAQIGRFRARMTLQMFEKFAQTRGGQAYRRVSGAVVHVDDEYRNLLAQVLADPREATDRAALETELDQARQFEEQARKKIDPEPRDEGKP